MDSASERLDAMSAPAPESQAALAAASAERVVGEYYARFNSRELAAAATLFSADAVVDHFPCGEPLRGGEGYLRSADAWLAAFPDAVLSVERVSKASGTMYDVDLISHGTHHGVLDIGIYVFRPSGARTSLRLRELLDIRGGRIAASSLSFDVSDLVRQLSTIDFPQLMASLRHIRDGSEELLSAAQDAARRQELAERLGPHLDAARRALRPYYDRRY